MRKDIPGDAPINAIVLDFKDEHVTLRQPTILSEPEEIGLTVAQAERLIVLLKEWLGHA